MHSTGQGPTRWNVLVGRFRRELRSERAALLGWWYLVCVAATAAAKLAALGSVYRHSDAFVLDEMAAGSGPPLPRVLLLARDLLQCALIAAAVFALGAVFSSRARSFLQRLAASALAMVILGNHVSFLQLGTFASSAVLGTAWGWVRLHPQSLLSYCTPGAAAVFLLCGFGVLLPGLMVRAGRKVPAIATHNQRLPSSA